MCVCVWWAENNLLENEVSPGRADFCFGAGMDTLGFGRGAGGVQGARTWVLPPWPLAASVMVDCSSPAIGCQHLASLKLPKQRMAAASMHPSLELKTQHDDQNALFYSHPNPGLPRPLPTPRALSELARVLKPGASVAVLDFNNSTDPVVDNVQVGARGGWRRRYRNATATSIAMTIATLHLPPAKALWWLIK